MRGKPRTPGRGPVQQRNIPAYAGKTRGFSCAREARSEHPRVCGENPPLIGGRHHHSGTSPRMRGKLKKKVIKAIEDGNIPAYAGKTHISKSAMAISREHPRVCGENRALLRCGPSLRGTSPRMRGKHVHLIPQPPAERNIPAYAGKTGAGRLFYPP